MSTANAEPGSATGPKAGFEGYRSHPVPIRVAESGRALGFRSLGDPHGAALFFLHGTPGSRLAYSEADPLARLPGIRLILPERPGYGLSDFQPDRVLLDWPRDVAQLVDALGIERFAVGGESGGGPHALACAFALPGRVVRALVLSSPAPADFPGATRGMAFGNRLGVLVGRYAPSLVRRMTRGFADYVAKEPERALDAIARQTSAPDRALLADRAFRDAMLRDLREAYRQGGDGHAVDGALGMTARGWGFDLREIAVPVHLWHGAEDRLVSRPMAERLATQIPHGTARIVPGAGHLLTERAEVVEEMRAAMLGATD